VEHSVSICGEMRHQHCPLSSLPMCFPGVSKT